MTNTSNDKARQKRHKREKATIEHLVDKVYEDQPAEERLQNSTTDSGLPVEGTAPQGMGSEERRSTDLLTGR